MISCPKNRRTAYQALIDSLRYDTREPPIRLDLARRLDAPCMARDVGLVNATGAAHEPSGLQVVYSGAGQVAHLRSQRAGPYRGAAEVPAGAGPVRHLGEARGCPIQGHHD